jgi:hypothetical protein
LVDMYMKAGMGSKSKIKNRLEGVEKCVCVCEVLWDVVCVCAR